MTDEVVPEDIGHFIIDRLESVAELEALLMLRQVAPKQWDARALAGRLYISETQTEELLSTLCEKGLAKVEAAEPPLYRYEPATPELALILDGLARIYAAHIVPVTNLIHSKPKHKVQGFADAFKFRKDG
jgi:hypothetical protein